VDNIILYLKLQVLTVMTRHYEAWWRSTNISKQPSASILRSKAEDSSKMSAYLPDYIASHPMRKVTFIVFE